MDRSHKGEVKCTGIITLACLIFEFVPFVVFHTWILFGACPSFTTWGKTGVSCDNLLLLLSSCKKLRHFEMHVFEMPLLLHETLDAFKLKEFADDNFKFDKNGRKFSRWVENTVQKGQSACFSQCFQKTFLQTHKNKGLFGKGFRQGIIKEMSLNIWSLKAAGQCLHSHAIYSDLISSCNVYQKV